MTIQQSTHSIEDGRKALVNTLFGENAPKLLNIKCFPGGDLTTASDLSHAANRMIQDRRSGKSDCSVRFEEQPQRRRTAAELIAAL